MTPPSLKFLTTLEEASRPLLADGAMGTMLYSHGVGFGQCFDAINLTDPALVARLHARYIQAGAQIVLTNTFGANRYKLAEHGKAEQVEAINRAGVEIARQAATKSGEGVFVAGDVGPLGVRLAPFGRVQSAQARQAFVEQITALVEAGPDLIVIETFSDLQELCEAVRAAREVCELPVVASMTFTRDDRTILGDDPVSVVQTLQELGPDLVGVNCSGGPAQILRILKRMYEVAPDLRYAAKPNAGFPEQVGGRIMYPAGPDYFGEFALAYLQAGVKMIGGCCGTTPDHTQAMQKALADLPTGVEIKRLEITRPSREPATAKPLEPTRLARRFGAGEFVVSVEMQPPRGLSTHKLLAGASLLAEAGADVINVADSPMARMRMSPWAVCNLIQRKVNTETTLHFPTRGRNLLRVQGDLLAAHALGVRNVFVVMGDPTAIGDYPDAMDDYDLVPSGLIHLIKHGFNTGVDHAGVEIGQPTSFFVGSALNLTPNDPEREIKVLRRKVAAGADFLLTQPVFQPEQAEAFLERYEREWGPLELPILLGVFPLYGRRHAGFLHNEVPGIQISLEVFERLEAAGDAAPQEGVRIAIELVRRMRAIVAGVYVIPAFGRYDLVAEIIEAVKG